MDYQGYENYMRSILGYSPMQRNNIYNNSYGGEEDYYYYNMPTDVTPVMRNEEELNKMYPEIYKIVYPMVCKICNQNMSREITNNLLEEMTDEIYQNIETEDKSTNTMRSNLKNGDVRNPNAKEPEIQKETRQMNYLLRDLIRILILRELGRPYRPPIRPPFPPPMSGSRPPMGPGPRPRDFY